MGESRGLEIARARVYMFTERGMCRQRATLEMARRFLGSERRPKIKWIDYRVVFEPRVRGKCRYTHGRVEIIDDGSQVIFRVESDSKAAIAEIKEAVEYHRNIRFTPAVVASLRDKQLSLSVV